MPVLTAIKWHPGFITSSSYRDQLQWHICGFILMILHLHSLFGLSIQSSPSWWTLPWLPIDHITVSMDTEHHGLNLWLGLNLRWRGLRRSGFCFCFFFFFPPLSSGVTLSSPQAMQEDCSAHGKWLANPEPKQIPDRADVADCHSHSKFRWHRWESCACFGFCHLVLYMWICRLRCCKTYLQTPEWNLLKAALSIIHPRI